jgi:hypothetical protein
MEGIAMFDGNQKPPKPIVTKEVKIITRYVKESHAGTLAMVLLLALAVAGSNWYTNHRQDQEDQQLARVRQLQTSVDDLKTRLETAEDNLRFMSDRTSTVDDRLANIEGRSVRLSDSHAGGRAANGLHHQRISFEISMNHSQRLLPGVSVSVESTDAEHHRYNGWVWLSEDRRTVWIRNQAAQVPLTIYQQTGGPPLQLVVSQVHQHDVTGYLLVPGSQMEAPSGGN